MSVRMMMSELIQFVEMGDWCGKIGGRDVVVVMRRSDEIRFEVVVMASLGSMGVRLDC